MSYFSKCFRIQVNQLIPQNVWITVRENVCPLIFWCKAEVDTLKGMLEKSPAISEETLKELGRLVREGGFMEKVETYRKEEHADFGVSLYLTQTKAVGYCSRQATTPS